MKLNDVTIIISGTPTYSTAAPFLCVCTATPFPRFETYLIEDLTKAVSPATAEKMRKSLKKAGVSTILSADVAGSLAPKTEEGVRAHRMSFGGVVGVRLATYNQLLQARASVTKSAADENGLTRAYSEILQHSDKVQKKKSNETQKKKKKPINPSNSKKKKKK